MHDEELSVKLSMFNAALHKALRKEMSQIGAYSMTEQETLIYIFKNGTMLPTDLAALTRISTPSMSQILRKMEEQGIVKRTPSTTDKRKVYVSLTESGNALVEQVKDHKNEYLKNLLETKLSEAERKLLERALPVLNKLIS